MRKLIGVIAVTVALLAWAGEVQAACTYTTYVLPNGTVVTCSTCCYGNHCTVNCF